MTTIASSPTIGLPAALAAATLTTVALAAALLWPETDPRPAAERAAAALPAVLDVPLDETKQRAPVDTPEEEAAKVREYVAEQATGEPPSP
jgi:hypothetical protein